MSNLLTYKASAGSGKTYTLAVEYIKQLFLSEDFHAHRHILAVTFTKDATGEMKDRILAELYGLAAALDESKDFLASLQTALEESGKPMTDSRIQTEARRVLTEILHDYSRFYVGTIDGFFQRVLRNLARELGKGSRFNLELNTVRIMEETVRTMIEKSNEDEKLLEWIGDYIEEKIEQGKSWRIDRELRAFGMNIFNECFQEHEAALRRQTDENPNLIADMITMHKKLKSDFERRMKTYSRMYFSSLEENGIDPSDLVGGSKSYPSNYFKRIADCEFSEKRLMNNTIVSCMMDSDKWTSGKLKGDKKEEITHLAETVLMPLLKEAENSRTAQIEKYNSSVLILRNIHQLGLLWDIAQEMETQNRENNRFMLSQTALFLNQMIDDSDASFVYEKIGSQIKHVMIDEFQDTSRLQWSNFRSLLSEVLANNRFSLIVGDVKQSIYRWRNGDWGILNNIENTLPTEIKNLDTNYRSARRVVEFNNAFFVQAAEMLDIALKDEFAERTASPFPTAYKTKNVMQKASKQEAAGYVSVDFYAPKEVSIIKEEKREEELAGGELLLEKLKELQQAGVQPAQICILTRTNREIVEIAEYLATQKAFFPELARKQYLDIISNDAFRLAASPALRIIVEALRSLSDPENRVPRTQLLLMWQEMREAQTLDMHSLLQDIDTANSLLPEGFRREDYASLSIMPLYELILHIYRIFELDKIKNQSSYLFAFLDNLMNYLQQNPSDIAAFLKYWDDELNVKSVPNETGLGGVRAMTIHKSKGLQFHTVIVAFANWKMGDSRNNIVWCGKKESPFDLEILPVNHTLTMKDSLFADEYAEEIAQLYMDNLNIAYVAFTRAERNLCILAKQPVGKQQTIENLLFQAGTFRLIGDFDEEKQKLIYGTIESGESKLENEKRAAQNIQLSIFSSELPPLLSPLNKNVFKRKKRSVPIDFKAQQMPDKGNIFRQSNRSRAFIASGETTENQYIKQGNVMHALFAKIHSRQDIESAVKELVFEGIITQEEEKEYAQKIEQAIEQSDVKQWFDGNFRLFNECEILQKDENGKTQSRRPDRVMINENEAIVVDYKFGEPKAHYTAQVQQYVDLLGKMGHRNVQGFLWYVSENRLEKL